MIARILVCLLMLSAIPVWPQAEPSVTVSEPASGESLQMRIPAALSAPYHPSTLGSQQRTNYLTTEMILNTAYDNNVLGSATTKSVADVSYTVWSTITLDQTTPRQHRTFTYRPGFMFYEPTRSLNEVEHNATLGFQYRPSRYSSVFVGDSLQKSSNEFNQSNLLSGGTESGSTQSPPMQVIAPFANRLSNTTDISVNYQFNRDRMIGAGGTASKLDYLNSSQAPGFYDSDTRGGSAFYNQRLSGDQYIGGTYQVLWTNATPVNARASITTSRLNTRTESLLLFYSISPRSYLSISLAAGPQHFDTAQSNSTNYRSWVPYSSASIDWQRRHASCSASYFRIVTGGLGVLGVFGSNNVAASARWQLTRTWTFNSTGTYAINKNLVPQLTASIPGGRTVAGILSIQHLTGEHLKTEVGYAHMHQSYSGVPSLTGTPDSDRVYISISYQITRPLGR